LFDIHHHPSIWFHLSGPFRPLTFVCRRSSSSTHHIFKIVCTTYIRIQYHILQTVCTYSLRLYIDFL
jgi:hypothetical protein